MQFLLALTLPCLKPKTIDLDKLDRLERFATPAPWDKYLIFEVIPRMEDAELIAELRNSAREMIDRLREMEGKCQ